ncbi:MAG: hypothetical protein KDE51_04325 [Anaerolineales bacterium]|nr:hypothetical protein [Anaerolineales bacterium]
MGTTKQIVGRVGAHQIILMDSISYIAAEDEDQIIISGSHGGLAAANYALEHPPLLVAFNDAGVGKDEAGIMALQLLDEAGIAAVAVYHTTARIGEAQDTWENGVIGHVNVLAWGMNIILNRPLQQNIKHHLRL